MKYTLQILRRNVPGEKPVWKAYELETETESVTLVYPGVALTLEMMGLAEDGENTLP